MKILVADDDVTSRLVLSSILSKWGEDVETVCDGNEAWAYLQAHPDSLIAILDWEMPGVDGVDLCRMAKSLERKSPLYVILLTGRQKKEDIVTGLDSGADDYITKPFNDGELRARLRVAERLIQTQKKLTAKIDELAEVLDHVKTLQGIIPICMHCHKIRVDDEAWHRLEAYIEAHSEAHFSHSVCPECMRSHYPDLWENT